MPTRTTWFPDPPGGPLANRGSVTGCTLNRVGGGALESCPIDRINASIQGTVKTMARGDNDKRIGRNVVGGAAGGALVGTAVGAMACKGLVCGLLAGGPAGLAVGGLLGLVVGAGKVAKSLLTATSTDPTDALPAAPDVEPS